MNFDDVFLDGGSTDFSGFTAPPNAPGQAESRAGKTALDVYLAGLTERPAWTTVYEDLMTEQVEMTDGKVRHRWDWRKALYIAWSVVPREKRQPKTEQELASLMRLASTRIFRKWKEKDPEIEERIIRLPRQMLTTYTADVYQALVDVASQAIPGAHQDRKLFFELAGEYSPRVSMTGTDDGPVRIVVEYVNGKRPTPDAT
jgi:hypothetical protein